MIPKIIHYCWFGKAEKPKKIQKCIQSWKCMLKGFRFIEWNEDNFDYMAMDYTKQAYQVKKYAFVSDVARLKALYEIGGIYLDTDVEILKPLDDILEYKCVFGLEERNYVATSFMACEVGYPLIKQFYEEYKSRVFTENFVSGKLDTNVLRLTEILTEKGLKKKNVFQNIEDIIIFPREYFSPYDYINCIDLRNKNSFCIHYFYVTWQPNTVRLKKMLKKFLGKILGKKRIDKIRRYYE